MKYRYQVGGSLAVDAVSYVARSADCKLYERLLKGDCCYIFNSRQMGKSSLLVQTFHRLKQKGYRCAIIDLTAMGSEQVTALQWYKALVAQIYFELGLTDLLKFKNWWDEREEFSYLQRLNKFIEELLLVHFPNEKIVIFIDEIDTVLSLDFAVDDFFALIRYCHERRTINPDYQRITFALAGVATPSDLIRDKTRTPFNIGRAIALENFSYSEVEPLLAGLQSSFGNPERLMQAIIEWTGGQPFLTQKLCQLIVCDNRPGLRVFGSERDYVDNLVQAKIISNWESQDEPEHFRTIRDRLLRRENLAGRLLGIYQQMLASPHSPSKEGTDGGEVKVDDSREQVELVLSGLVVKWQGYLAVKNQIYRQIFDYKWVEKQLHSLRPYSQGFQAWINSEQKDKSRLLKGKALQDALLWSQGKSLSDLDYRYLAASQEADREEVQKTLEAAQLREVQTRLTEAERRSRQEQKANRLQRWLLTVVSMGLAVASGLGITAYIQYRKATVGEINALAASAEGLFNSDQPLDALVAAIKAYEKLRQIYANDGELTNKVEQTLNRTVSGGIETNRLSGFERGVHAVAVSPDGQTIATGSLDSQIKLWQRDGTLLKTLSQHSDRIWALAYSPDSVLASGSADGTVKLWQQDGTLRQTLRGHRWGVYSIMFSPDGKLIASSGLDGKINIWQRNGRLLKTITEDSAVLALAFSPDGQILASGGNDTVIKLRNLEGKVLKTIQGNGAIQRLVFSPDGQILASAQDNGTIDLWHRNGNRVQTIYAHSNVIEGLAFSPDSQTLVSGSKDSEVKLWQLNGSLLLALSAHEGGVRGIAYSPDGKTIASASVDNTVRLWQPEGNQSVKIIWQSSAVSALAVSPDGKKIASGNREGTIQLWDFQANRLASLSGHKREVKSIAFGFNGEIASASRDKTVKLWNTNGDFSKTVARHNNNVNQVDFLLETNEVSRPRSASIVSAGWDGILKFGDRYGNTVKEIKACNQITAMKISFTNRVMAVSCVSDNTIKIIDLSGKVLKMLKGHQALVNRLDFNQDSSLLVSASNDGTVKLWQDGTLLKTLDSHLSEVKSVSFSPDESLIASASSDRTIKIWKTDGTLLKTLNGHTQTVNAVTFSPDGKFLISGSDDKTIRIWNLDIVLNTESTYEQGCNLIGDYLRTNIEVAKSDRTLCDGVGK